MLKTAEERGSFRARGSAAGPPSGRRRGRIVVPALLALVALASAAPVRAGGFDFDRVPDRFQYAQYSGLLQQKPRTVAFQRNEPRPIEAPTRFRVSSILKYSLPLGDTGLVLRVKAPLKPHKIVTVELRF